jgi:predicted ArsR family transcriptional regulator
MVSTVSVLADDVRRRLYFHVRAMTEPVTRDGAASAVGISRKLAAFHLEKLVDEGLIRVIMERPAARLARPGRSPKLYRPSDAEISLNIPPRQYDLMAKILLAAVRIGGTDARASALEAARERGREIGRGVRGLLRPGKLGLERSLRLTMQALTETGYEPEVVATPTHTEIRLRNCPFHRLLEEDRLLVCTLNCSLVGGMIAGLDTEMLAADLLPSETHCCVTVRSHGALPSGPTEAVEPAAALTEGPEPAPAADAEADQPLAPAPQPVLLNRPAPTPRPAGP